jgi:hypothetical protein
MRLVKNTAPAPDTPRPGQLAEDVQWLEAGHGPSICKYYLKSRRARIGSNCAFSVVSEITEPFSPRIIVNINVGYIFWAFFTVRSSILRQAL